MEKKIFLILAIFSIVVTCLGKVQECEVCESVINKLRAQLPDDANQDEIELKFKEFCKTAKGREEKFVS